MTINGFGNGAYAYQTTKASRQKEAGADLPKADELDKMQKSGGFVNTMAELSASEKALYDELISKGKSDAAPGLLLVGMSRVGMSGQQITLPNGNTFDPTKTEVTAANIRELFKYAFVGNDGHTDRIFDALASALDKKTN